MSNAIYSVPAGAVDWAEKCHGWARAGAEFWVLNPRVKDLVTCQQLCGELHYQYEMRDGHVVAVFTPLALFAGTFREFP